jgi:hypothetical protein
VSGIFSWHSGFPWTAVYTNIDGGNVCKLVYNTGCAQPNGSNNQLRPATYSGTAGSSQGINTFKTQNGNFTGITTGTSANAGAPFLQPPLSRIDITSRLQIAATLYKLIQPQPCLTRKKL